MLQEKRRISLGKKETDVCLAVCAINDVMIAPCKFYENQTHPSICEAN